MSNQKDPKDFLYEGERLDDLQRDGMYIIQNPKWFCFGMDAVLLSAYAKVKEGEKCLDLGCGNGIIPLLLSGRTKGSSFTGLELQKDIAEMAKRSVAYNKAIARHELFCTFEDVVKAAAKLLRPGGRFYLVHRPFRLAEIISCMVQYKLEPKRMRLVYPYVDKEPNMVLIEGVRGGNRQLTVEKPLIAYEDTNQYTEEVRRMYYD